MLRRFSLDKVTHTNTKKVAKDEKHLFLSRGVDGVVRVGQC